MLVDRTDRALGVGIEQAQRFQLVTEEIEPEAGIKPGGNDIEDRSAHGEFASVDRGIAALVPLAAQQRDQRFVADFHARLDELDRFANAKRGQHPLGQGVGGGDQQLRSGALGLKLMQRGKAARADRKRGAGAVVGKAVPGREFDDIKVGREEARGFGHRGKACLAIGHEDRPAFCRARKVCHHQWLAAPADAGQCQR